MSKGETKYSEEIKGERGNYNWPTSFDLTGGFLGINQRGAGERIDRVLLSPKQVQALIEFVGKAQ